MADPVMVDTGHTYDRSCIERWLQQGNRTCPVTGMRLRHLELVPNHALRNAIQVRGTRPSSAAWQQLPPPGGKGGACLPACLAGWLAAWLAGWLAGWLGLHSPAPALLRQRSASARRPPPEKSAPPAQRGRAALGQGGAAQEPAWAACTSRGPPSDSW